MTQKPKLKRDLGLFITTALVVGNMMGSGIFILLASLAQETGPGATMLGWLISGTGALFIALSFANLGSKMPVTGGPYEYSKRAFGHFIGFQNAWLYWNSSWIGTIASLTGTTAYVAAFFPILNESRLAAFLFTSAILWIFTYINILGVRKAGIFQTILVITEIVLFIIFIVAALKHYNPEYLKPMFPEGKGLNTVPTAAALTLWAFTGFETAAITAGEVKNGARNVRLGTIYGIIIGILLYFTLNFTAMTSISQKDLINADGNWNAILTPYFGSSLTKVIIVTELVSILGTTFACILTTARMSYAAAENKIFPKVFENVHPKYKTPDVSLIIAAILGNILLALNYTKSLQQVFTFMILLATLAGLPVYASTAAAEIRLSININNKPSKTYIIKKSIIPAIAFIYSLWAIYGSGLESVLYGVLLAALGIPVYFYMKKRNR
ncbi:amino acid permease [Clostridium sp. YIM B02515]|uniref:Amino acid permease n=1 Tax=Clostridium rhizosphaerae TaxID=2803861 RepID=A0ABS1T9I3_9CLOT|nr:amino acid permease [Clostridium rhizosphaerae]MBL4935757.1 amino acid permease [Clostridium rhizosphaerae]